MLSDVEIKLKTVNVPHDSSNSKRDWAMDQLKLLNRKLHVKLMESVNYCRSHCKLRNAVFWRAHYLAGEVGNGLTSSLIHLFN